MEIPDSNPYPEFVFVQADKSRRPAPPKPQPKGKYQSLTFLTIVIQGVYALLFVSILAGNGIYFSLPKQFDEAKKLHALLQNPPAGTDRFQLRSAHEQLKTIAEALKQSSETLIGICAVMVAFSGILGLAFTGWVYKATTNLLLLGVRKLIYSPLISALGIFWFPSSLRYPS